MTNKKDEVYDIIVERLVGARYSFGENIPVKELAAEIGVSRQPLMTALARLSADGFVRIVPQVGCQVVDPSSTEIADFFLMFQRMEGLLAELAATRRTEAQILELEGIHGRIVRLVDAKGPAEGDYVELNRSFHKVVNRMAHSPLLGERQIANFSMCDFFINHSIGFERLHEGVVQEHAAILRAIELGASDRARAVMEVHIGTVAQAVLSSL